MRHMLEIWQEVSRHRELADTLERVTPLAADALAFDVLALRRIDPVQSRVDTLAAVHATGRPAMHVLGGVARTELDDVAQAVRAPRLVEKGHPAFVALSPWPGARQLAVVPLDGVLLVLARNTVGFSRQTLSAARSLVAPLTVALENDHRLRELARFKEASESSSNRARLLAGPLDETIMGADNGLKQVMAQVERVAPTQVPVLLLAETGSGKEVIVRALHERSPRAAGPLVRVNCGAIPAEVIDRELFGHEKGAATATHRGWFERADGGTLFLDEVAELPEATQVRLLQVLREGTFERVGSSRSMRIDVRIVAATHRDPADLVQQGLFRSDLWRLLDVFPLKLPALRERLEDLPGLVRHFARRSAERLGVPALEPAPQDLERLSLYRWPGNVRELAAVIERAAILGHGLKLDVDGALGAAPSLVPVAPELPRLDEAMVHHIERALEQTRGRIEGPNGAAALLRINPHTLRSRMRKLGVQWDRFRKLAAG